MIRSEYKISFIIPVYNAADTIEETVKSIYDGNFENGDEVIVLDDCSTDNTPIILNRLSSANPNFKVYKHDYNKGSAAAGRNTAIGKAKNEIIFCLDADNILVPNSIRKLKNYMLEQQADCAAFGELHYFMIADNLKKFTHNWLFKSGTITLAHALSGPVWPGPSGNYMYLKSSWERAGRYHEFIGGSYDSWAFGIRQLATGTKMVVLEGTYYNHLYGYNSTFVRDANKANPSIIGLQILLPYLKQFEQKTIEYLFSKNYRFTWFDNLEKRPLRVKGFPAGNLNGKVVFIDHDLDVIDDNQKRVKLFENMLNKLRSVFNYFKNIVKSVAPKFIIHKYDDYKIKHLLRDGFREDVKMYLLLNKDSRFPIEECNHNIQLYDKDKTTTFDAHYIYHPAWAARVIAKIMPVKHVDISSKLYFSTIVSAFVPFEFYDYRPADIRLSGLRTGSADLTKLQFTDNSIESLSCMHTVEYIGLGRYGDPVDPEGDLKAIAELKRVVAPGGSLLFVVPVGKPILAFNAHRIYSYEMIMEYFKGFELVDFSLVDDDGNFIEQAEPGIVKTMKYGCGCFWFKK